LLRIAPRPTVANMPASRILVIDDQPINVQLLKKKLEREGLQVAAAYSGQEGLDLIQKNKPDLILLDVMMPDMDGIEVCQRLQANEDTRSIPVIFITARTTKESKLEGLAVGAVDYITKPIDLDETLARVQTQLRFVTINREMVNLQRRLQEVRRAATIGAVTEGIAHNLNNLLSLVLGHLELLKMAVDRPEDVQRNIQQIDTAVLRIVGIVRQLTSLVSRDQSPLTRISLQSLLESGIARFHAEAKLEAPVAIENPLGALPIESNAEVFEGVLAKLLVNAWEAYDAEPGVPRPITIRTRGLDFGGRPGVEIAVEDQGRGIDPEIRDHMFEPFTSTKRTVGVGMGLTVARHAVEGIGGQVELVDRPGGGTRALLLHPVEGKAQE
jgi:two-component system sensor histidine kinase/response regulator